MKLRLVSRVIVLALVLLVGAIIVVRGRLAASHTTPPRAAPQGMYLPADADMAFTLGSFVGGLERS
jgi:hypothetical protein